MTTSDSVAIRENIDAACNGQRRGSVVLPGPEAHVAGQAIRFSPPHVDVANTSILY